MKNEYQYTSGAITHKGFFNIYQSVGGAVMLVMGNRFTELTKEQIENDLCIDVYSLQDFNLDAYLLKYSTIPRTTIIKL